MTVDQKGAICSKALASRPKALLRDHVRDVDGKTQDIVVLRFRGSRLRCLSHPWLKALAEPRDHGIHLLRLSNPKEQ